MKSKTLKAQPRSYVHSTIRRLMKRKKSSDPKTRRVFTTLNN